MQYDDFQVETFLRTGAHEQELRDAFGDRLYDELARLAQAIDHRPTPFEATRRKVLILPGIMGSRLSAVEDGQPDLVWIQPSDLATGGIAKIAWGATVVASGTVFAPYLRLRLSLTLAGFDAEFLPYDWRQSPGASARALMRHLRKNDLSDVTLVCHSMGGLVARQMAAEDADRDVISMVVTIGTPNKGSYSPVQVFDLSHSLLGPLGLVDLHHDRRTLVEGYLRAFPGLVEMMPTPTARPSEGYFSKTGWPSAAVPPTPTALTSAKAAVAALPPPDDRFRQIIGTGERTVVSARKSGKVHIYTMSDDGDGTVPRDLAEMGDVPRYYCEGGHGWLCNKADVIAATIDLIHRGETSELPRTAPVIATESVPIDISSADLAVLNESTAMPQRETDLAGTFLSIRMDDPTPRTAVIGTEPPDASAPGAYPADVVDAASARWRASDAERGAVLQSQLESHPLAAETPRRLGAYARRLITQVDAAHGNGTAHRISRDLETALDGLTDTDAPGGDAATPIPALLERVIGEAEEFLSVMFIKRAVVAARPVGRIISTLTGRGIGTGFLVSPGVIMTNHHVLPNAVSAGAASIQFRYELDIDSRESLASTFTLDPERLFHTDERLDMAIVAVSTVSHDGVQTDEFGHLPLVGVEGKIRKGEPVNIIQHPLAGRKQVVFRESLLTALPSDADHVAHYTGDTQPGSSGAPVFSDRWEVIALHHSGVPDQAENGSFITLDGGIWNRETDPQMKTLKWVANEGIRISRIVTHLKTVPQLLRAQGRPGADLVEDVLAVSRRAERDGIFFQPQPGPAVERTPPQSDGATGLFGAPQTPQPAAGEGGITIPLNLRITLGLPCATTSLSNQNR
jgi:pimeloyl-ACP methyl ester carboxylesterase